MHQDAANRNRRLDQLSLDGNFDDYGLLLDGLTDDELDREIARRGLLSSCATRLTVPGQVVFDRSDMADWVCG